MAKEVTGFIKLQIKAGAANPAPPVGPALGSKGLNLFIAHVKHALQFMHGLIHGHALIQIGIQQARGTNARQAAPGRCKAEAALHQPVHA